MKKIFLLSFWLTSIVYHYTKACSFTPVSFCDNSRNRNDGVLLVRFIEQNQNSCKAVVLDVLKGNIIEDTIVIYDFVTFCMEYDTMKMRTISAEVGDTFLIQLPKITEVINAWDTIGNYRFENYLEGINELRYTSDTLYGFTAGFAGAPQSYNRWKISYAEYKAIWSDISKTCSDFLLTSINDKDLENSINIYPNPVNRNLTIALKDANTLNLKDVQILVYDVLGKLLINSTLSNNNLVLDFENYSKGFYNLQVKSSRDIVIYKQIVKID